MKSHPTKGRKNMPKLKFQASANREELLRKYSNSDSVEIGPKALPLTSREDVEKILQAFDDGSKKLIEKEQTPGRVEFCLRADKSVGTEAVVPYDSVHPSCVFEVVKHSGTKYKATIRVALIDKKDMPSTNLIHGFYGPYGDTGEAGFYGMTYGAPRLPFPRDLHGDEPAVLRAFSRKCEVYWRGADGQSGHVFLATPEELENILEEMKTNKLKVTGQMARLKSFRKSGLSPLRKKYNAQPSEEAIDLGTIKLKGSQKAEHEPENKKVAKKEPSSKTAKTSIKKKASTPKKTEKNKELVKRKIKK